MLLLSCNIRKSKLHLREVFRIEAFRSSLGTNSNVATQEAIDLDET